MERIQFDSNEDVPDEVWEQYAEYMAYGDWEPGKTYDLQLTMEVDVISSERNSQ